MKDWMNELMNGWMDELNGWYGMMMNEGLDK